jgi:hypothetical protein
MNKLVKINATRVITKSGRLVSRKAFMRLISPKMKLSKAKERVRALKKGLSKVRELTELDPKKLEYVTAINKTTKVSNVPIKTGYVFKGVKVVSVPKANQTRNWMIHSHPDNSLLSVPDLKATKKGGNIFATTLDGSIYRSTSKKEPNEIIDEYNTIRDKLLKTGVVKNLKEQTSFLNPNVAQQTINQDIGLAVQHKLLSTLHKKGFIHYRARMQPGSRRIIDRYSELKDIELKRCYLGDAEFSKKSKYYISPDKWYKLPKSIQKKIRDKEKKYNHNYSLAVKKDPQLKKLYKKIGIT